MVSPHDVIIRKIKEHTRLSREDADGLRGLSYSRRPLAPNEDVVRQGEDPKVSALVLSGMVARYHTRPGGSRQYLSLHIAGDLPDLQSLFIDHMDHSVCAIGPAAVGLIPHRGLLELCEARPSVAFALWRETLIDASIFREAITNNSSRAVRARIAHFLCELYYRSQAAGISSPGSCELPLSQIQIGEALGISVVTTNRGLQAVRRSGAMELRDSVLHVRNWKKLVEIGEFDPSYLHLKRQNRI